MKCSSSPFKLTISPPKEKSEAENHFTPKPFSVESPLTSQKRMQVSFDQTDIVL